MSFRDDTGTSAHLVVLLFYRFCPHLLLCCYFLLCLGLVWGMSSCCHFFLCFHCCFCYFFSVLILVLLLLFRSCIFRCVGSAVLAPCLPLCLVSVLCLSMIYIYFDDTLFTNVVNDCFVAFFNGLMWTVLLLFRRGVFRCVGSAVLTSCLLSVFGFF